MIRRFFSVLALVGVLFTTCCTQPVSTPPDRHFQTKSFKIFHADVTFTPEERKELLRAVEVLNHQANGVIVADVVFDLGWEEEGTKPVEGDDQIMKIVSTADSVKKIDSDGVKGNVTLGWAEVNYDEGYAKVYLIYDRLIGEGVFEHVALHELLHAFKLLHVKDDPDAVMFWLTDLRDIPAQCMNVSDLQELCRVWGCKPEQLNFCE